MEIKEKLNSFEDLMKLALPSINDESKKIWYKLNDETVFEQKCFKELEYAYNNLSEIKNPKYLIYRIVKRSSAHCINEVKKKNVVSLDSLAGIHDNKKEIGFQVKDGLADVELEVSLKEEITSLAGGDKRKEIIFKSWLLDGCTCVKEISGLLADKLGGKQESHRKYVQRIQGKYRKALAS